MNILRLICLLSVLTAGCGGANLTQVSGKVTLDGNPVADAVISFVPDGGTGPTGIGSTDSSGKYAIACPLGIGVPPGAYSVKIKSREKPMADLGDNPLAGLEEGTPAYIEKYQELMSGPPNRSVYRPKKDPNAIPEKYNSGAELKATVGGGSQSIDFELASK